MIRVGSLGNQGRMGQWVCRLIETEFSSSATLVAKASKGDALTPLLDTDVVIDFASPAAMIQLAQAALNSQSTLPAFVVGSTGWSPQEYQFLEKLSVKTPVLFSSNFSTGVFILSEILKNFAPTLEKLGYTPVIQESHHRHKKDAPSGTAISLQRAIDHQNPNRIQTHSIRAGEVVGEHEVGFFGLADQIKLSHSAQDRSIFARGAIEVALWLATTPRCADPHRGILGMTSYFNAAILR